MEGGNVMAKIQVPFETAEKVGVYLDLDVPDQNLVQSFIPQEPSSLPSVSAAALYAVEHPLDCKPLSEIVRRGDRVVIITENQFRAAPADQILRPILEILRTKGAEVKIVIGNGKVPPLTREELEHKLGKETLLSGIPIECNDVSKPENYAYLGTTTRGVPLFVLKSVAQADVKITVSTTQATLWGYGGSGMVIPAVSSNETIEMNHMFSLPSDCRPGNNQCHMQADKYEAASMASIDMGVFAIVNNHFEMTYIGAGDFISAHLAGIRAYDRIYRFNAAQFAGAPADIVITGSSAPTNHLFFHTGWAVVNCDPICKDGGTIIQATPCPGYGGWPGFALMDLMKEYMPPSAENAAKALKSFYNKERELWAGCIWWKIYEVMTRKHVTVVTQKENLDMSRGTGLDATDSLQGAFETALKRHGSKARVAFVPYGRYTILDVG
jgi:nickel-dependent lactate racemase